MFAQDPRNVQQTNSYLYAMPSELVQSDEQLLWQTGVIRIVAALSDRDRGGVLVCRRVLGLRAKSACGFEGCHKACTL